MKDSFSPVKLMVSILISVFVSIAFAFLLLLVSSAVTVSLKDPASLVMPLSLASLGLSSALCGISVSLMNRRCDLPPCLLGSLSGAILVLVLFTLSFIPVSGGFSYGGGARVVIYGGVVLLSLLGSVVSRPRRKKHARYTKRRKR